MQAALDLNQKVNEGSHSDSVEMLMEEKRVKPKEVKTTLADLKRVKKATLKK